MTLASLHAAKGLEWDHVHLVGCSEGLLPISFADTPAAVDEERRLLYVGVTRARDSLSMSYALGRTSSRGGRRPSRFLMGLGDAVDAPHTTAAPAAPARARKRRAARSVPPCSACGASLDTAAARTLGRCESCPSTADPTLVTALRDWRSARAARDKVPAYVVLTDVTLVALAERRPGTAAGLLEIPGIAERKVETYGAELLAVLSPPD